MELLLVLLIGVVFAMIYEAIADHNYRKRRDRE